MIDMYLMYEKRHRERASYWISCGRPDYARGSICKAHKWQQKRREFEHSIYGAYPKTQLGDLLDEHLRKCEREFSEAFVNALYGTS